MYTEGYVAEIRVQKKTMTFLLEPATPYQFKNGESAFVISLGERPDKNKETGSCQATVHFTKWLEFTCAQELADFASLVAIKASHTRIGVEFDNKTVSKIAVM